jgi:stage II sporulation protein D
MSRSLAAAAIALTASACAGTLTSPELPVSRVALPYRIRVQVPEPDGLAVRDVVLEEYVRATALSEYAPASGDAASVGRMLEIQSIISRTYAVSHLARHVGEGFDLCATTHCQVFDPVRLQTSRWSSAAAEAAQRTIGTVLHFQGQPAQALFHADCGGHTSAASAVWGGANPPYLLSRPDNDVAPETHTSWEYRVDVDPLASALGADARTKFDGRLQALEILGRDDAGRADQIAIRGDRSGSATTSAGSVRVVRADVLRQVLTRAFGPRAIRSTWFEVRRDDRTISFAGRGFGHGVGLCQAGALARLRAGATLADVLRYYYPGTTLVPSPAALARRESAPLSLLK